jgi:hypothetical protein
MVSIFVELRKVRPIIDLVKARTIHLMHAPAVSVLLLAVAQLPMIVQIATPFVVDLRPKSHRQSGHLLQSMIHVRRYLRLGMHTVRLFMSRIGLPDLTITPLTVEDNSVAHVEAVSAKAG